MLILASRSPQRRAILETLGVPFEVRPADIEEIAEGLPNEAARHNALAKARAAVGGVGGSGSRGSGGSGGLGGLGGLGGSGGLGGREAGGVGAGDVVLGVDTLVTLGHEIYGKPRDADHARATLRALSGVTHTVVSAVAVIAAGSERVGLASTEVTFRRLDEPTIDWYIASEEWRDRAGGYAIQGRGAALVERIHGDYTNVVGLPVALLLELVPDLLGGGEGGF